MRRRPASESRPALSVDIFPLDQSRQYSRLVMHRPVEDGLLGARDTFLTWFEEDVTYEYCEEREIEGELRVTIPYHRYGTIQHIIYLSL